jgi:glyoxylase-like metal-dependent hydrolase (beta-lactamase superfamily II)
MFIEKFIYKLIFLITHLIYKMNKNIFKITFSVIITLLFITSTIAQEVHEPKVDSNWVKPYPPFRIAGNLYYVGTYDLGCYLITTKNGNILINTGTAASLTLIRNSIEALGFNFKDIKILLLMHAHYDHAGGVADIKEQTGAKVMTDAADEDVLESGGKTDYELGKYGVTFKPVKPDRLLHDGDVVKLADMQITMLHHPGHTKGACSYLFTVKDSGRSYRVLIANMPTIITDRKFADIIAYPTIQQDYAYTLKAMKNIQFDIWLAAHASQFNLQLKHPPGSAYNPSAFIDKQDYYDEINDLQKKFDEKLTKDAAQ